ncbi:MAG: hypothetical protein IJ157_02640 [Clostridia bacterium]|nr:hypothetical protein [Clostridia bacterium]
MKKLLVLICALALAALPALAETAYTAQCGGKPLLTLRYDEKAFRLGTESYLGSSVGGHTWLGMFGSDGATVEFSADLYDDLPANCSAAQLADYLNGRLSDEHCAYLEQYVPQSKLPFVIFSLNGGMGPSYYAAAVIRGYVVHFEIYNLRGGVNQDALTTLKTLLDGVKAM